VDIILECPDCCMAWLIQGVTGRETRLEGSSYECRLVEQLRALPLVQSARPARADACTPRRLPDRMPN